MLDWVYFVKYLLLFIAAFIALLYMFRLRMRGVIDWGWLFMIVYSIFVLGLTTTGLLASFLGLR